MRLLLVGFLWLGACGECDLNLETQAVKATWTQIEGDCGRVPVGRGIDTPPYVTHPRTGKPDGCEKWSLVGDEDKCEIALDFDCRAADYRRWVAKSAGPEAGAESVELIDLAITSNDGTAFCSGRFRVEFSAE